MAPTKSSAPTLVLDLDGTLVDSVPDLMASCNRVMAAQGLASFTATEITAMVGDGAAALVRRIMAARGRPAEPGDLDAFLTDYLAHAAVLTRPYPGVVPGLEALTEAGWTLAVCTNKPEAAARQVLDALDLSRFFTALAGGDTYPARKPDPSHLLTTIAAAGGDPARAVMVGDHHNDMQAARAAGVPAIFAAWGYGTADMADGAPAAHGFNEVPALAAALVGVSP